MSTPSSFEPQRPPSAGRLILTVGIATVIAAAILVTTVLPAEYGVDPLGAGRALGLTAIAEPPAQAEAALPLLSFSPVQEGPVARYGIRYRTDASTFSIAPYGWVEYKYRLDKGGHMLYSWTASIPAIYDFHAEPAGNPPPEAVTYRKGTAQEANGAFVAPFSGIHGWYWENTGGETLTVALTSAGFYSAATEFRSNKTTQSHDLTPLPRPSFDGR